MADFARRVRIGDIDDAQAAREPPRRRACRSCARGTGARRSARRCARLNGESSSLTSNIASGLICAGIAHVEGPQAGVRPPAPALLFLALCAWSSSSIASAMRRPSMRAGTRHQGMGRLGKRRMIVVRADGCAGCAMSETSMIAEAAVPAARPQVVAEAQRVMQPMAAAGPCRRLAAGDVLSGHPPARDFLGLGRVAHVVDHQDVADVALHLGRDVSVARIHVEAVHADAAGLVIGDQLRFRAVRDVVDLEAAVVVALRSRPPRARACRPRARPASRRSPRASDRARARRASSRARSRQLSARRPMPAHVALVIDDHDVADDARLVAVRVRIFERDLRHHARLLGSATSTMVVPSARRWGYGRHRRASRTATWPAPGRSRCASRRTLRASGEVCRSILFMSSLVFGRHALSLPDLIQFHRPSVPRVIFIEYHQDQTSASGTQMQRRKFITLLGGAACVAAQRRARNSRRCR